MRVVLIFSFLSLSLFSLQVPLSLISQKMDYLLLHRLSLLPKCTPNWAEWTQLANTAESLQTVPDKDRVHIAVVGKYTGLQDSYLSLIKAIEHAAIALRVSVKVDWIESTDLESSEPSSSDPSSSSSSSSSHVGERDDSAYSKAMKLLLGAHGILVPGGFGDRGISGKILAINHARTRSIPFFGICLGMQVAVIEFARNVLGISKANSEEFDKSAEEKVVVYMPEISKTQMGGTMRLGRRTTHFVEKYRRISKVQALYKQSAGTASVFGISIREDMRGDVISVDERHRHRYEVNPHYVPQLEEGGLLFVGMDDKKERMEVVEIADHPFFVGVQYHPEFQSRPQWPSPPFLGFIQAADVFARRVKEGEAE